MPRFGLPAEERELDGAAVLTKDGEPAGGGGGGGRGGGDIEMGGGVLNSLGFEEPSFKAIDGGDIEMGGGGLDGSSFKAIESGAAAGVEETKHSGGYPEADVGFETAETHAIIDIRERLAALVSLTGELPKSSAVQSFESDLNRARESFGRVEKVEGSPWSRSPVGHASHIISSPPILGPDYRGCQGRHASRAPTERFRHRRFPARPEGLSSGPPREPRVVCLVLQPRRCRAREAGGRDPRLGLCWAAGRAGEGR